ncbi:Helicase, RecD/TraA family OS=Chlorobaculum parvum (strain NCIB 8327) GN=Cpar_0761 PE=4 SV=1: AAA_30: UvrD_C_2 [Gemmataceae bacterium]|nr:Helicase, RecD/TraA family OS=Chlorobaculum parvum (strain NCIB 8327) GN=Cpar_0761 PE=4 SV=1: AAA_30: UvrD_C_2 [Gemmataceae bacterium]VTU01034.1 Helicase, RecD/TraA family OS=Chlorobaculum parvum (strain NCIB 8327) GN=Cpar_0761 PE=4 SV=1: AAA_30: UvrD_C_2 [Gemmataceae bacterium]
MATIFIPKDRTRREHVGMLDKVLWADDDAPKVILRLTDGASMIGPAPADQFVRGQLYRFYGTWKDGKRGCDFHFLTVVRDTPMSRGAVVHYLASTCRNVGKVTAERLFDKFGSDAVATLRREPRTVADTGLMAIDAAEEAARDLEVYAGAERTRVELHGMFAGRGFPGHLIDACIGAWGVRAPELIRRNPFALLVRRMPGCSFKRVDKLYLETGGRPGSLKRQAMCAVNIIRRDHSGSTWIDADAVAADLTRAVPGADPWRALILLRRGQWVRVRRLDGRRYVALRDRADAEMRIADSVRRLSRFPAAWPTEIPVSQVEGDGLPSAHQVEELRKATAGAVGCFVGGPGSGKTHVISYLLKAFLADHSPDEVAVAAPTGKAAVRAGESLRARGIEILARTQHQLLEIGRNGHDGDGWGFERNRDNPLDVTVLVIDESSMDDTSLLADTLDAVPDGGCVLFVGDEWQLPPVGHGAPLRDLLAGGVPQGKLTEIRRNAGSIVEACAAIKAGTPVRFDDRFDLAAPCPRNLRLLDCAADECLDVLADVIGQMSRFDPIWETQIITPLNDKGASAVTRAKINGRFGPVFNPDGRGAKGNPFRVGDKVICTTNTRLKCVVPLADRYGDPDMALDAANYQTVAGDRRGNEAEWYVANGEVGRVVAVSKDVTVARFGGVNVPLVRFAHGRVRESDDEDKKAAAVGGDFEPAWAVTCHKYQGSEVPCAILMVDPEAGSICDMNYWYTAISRARSACLLIGPKGAFEKQVKRVALTRRRTFLGELLREGL